MLNRFAVIELVNSNYARIIFRAKNSSNMEGKMQLNNKKTWHFGHVIRTNEHTLIEQSNIYFWAVKHYKSAGFNNNYH